MLKKIDFFVLSIKHTNMQFVSIESPYNNADPNLLKRNINYAILAVKDATKNYNNAAYAAYAAHLLNTQYVQGGEHGYLSDNVRDKFGVGRDKVIEITHLIRLRADKIVFYVDFGYSNGMLAAKELAENNDIQMEERRLPADMMKELQ